MHSWNIKQDANPLAIIRATWLTTQYYVRTWQIHLRWNNVHWNSPRKFLLWWDIFFLTVIIGMINYYSRPGVYSAIFFIYIQYHICKELGIEKRNIFLYVLSILYILSSATIALDVIRHVIVKTCIHYNKLFLYTTIRAGAASDHTFSSSTRHLPSVRDNSRLVWLPTLVCINFYHLFFIHLDFQRYTGAGSYGVVTFMSLAFVCLGQSIVYITYYRVSEFLRLQLPGSERLAQSTLVNRQQSWLSLIGGVNWLWQALQFPWQWMPLLQV